jgi:hypothetical protein
MNSKLSKLAEEIKKLQRETKSEFIKLEDGQNAVVKLDLNEDGSINRERSLN